MENAQNAIARIFYSRGAAGDARPGVIGGGVLVAERLVLTCAHVVAQALGLPNNIQELPAGRIRLDFPYLEHAQDAWARIMHWTPIDVEGRGDIALLELEEPVPAGLLPETLAEVDSYRDHDFQAYGFPRGYDEGEWASGRLKGILASGLLQLEGLSAVGAPVEEGFSGGPVWDNRPEVNGVIGIMVEADTRDGRRVAFAIPTQTLVRAIPALRPYVRRVEIAPQPARQPPGGNGAVKIPALPVISPEIERLVRKNRQAELEACTRYLETHQMLVITGMGGIGKSRLARVLVDLLPGADGPLWLDFESHPQITLGGLLEIVSAYLGPEIRSEVMGYRSSRDLVEPSAEQVQELVRYLNREPPVRLVFDNLETLLVKGGAAFADPGVEAFFYGLARTEHRAKVILTSRAAPELSDSTLLVDPFSQPPPPLKGLSVEDAVEMLRPFQPPGEPENCLVELASTMEGHPMALHLLAHTIQTLGAREVLRELGSFSNLTKYCREQLLSRLTEEESQAVRSMAVLRSRVPIEGFRQVTQAQAPVIDRLLDEGLLEQDESREYWLHQLVRDVAQPEDPLPAHRRAMLYFRSLPAPKTASTMDQLDPLREWHYHAFQAGDLPQAYKALFGSILAGRLMDWGEINLLAGFCNDLLAADSQQPALRAEDRSNVYSVLGDALRWQEEKKPSIAAYQDALRLLPGDASPKKRAWVLLGLAGALRLDGQFAEAKERCQEALTLLEPLPEDYQYANGLHVMGEIYRDQFLLDQAETYLKKALEIYQQAASKTGIAYATGDLGTIAYYRNDFASALAYYRQATQANQQIGDNHGEMTGHYNIGDVLLQQGDLEGAFESMGRAFEMASRKGIPTWQKRAGLPYIEAAISLGRLDEANQRLAELAGVLDADPAPGVQGQRLRIQAALQAAERRDDDAEDSFRQALDLLEGQEDPALQYEQAQALLGYASLLKRQGRLVDARARARSALEVFESIGNSLGIQAAERMLAGL